MQIVDRLGSRRLARLTGGGTEGNERLTGLTAVALLVLLLVEGVTIVFLGPLLSVHLFVGLVLIPPVALKLASTGYRFVRYYAGDVAYRAKGAPAIILRATAPVLAVGTVVVLASGVWLLLAGRRERDTVLPIHKISFIVWGVFFGVHVLGHVLNLPRILRSEYGAAREDPGGRAGRPGRQLALAIALIAGIALALLLLDTGLIRSRVTRLRRAERGALTTRGPIPAESASSARCPRRASA
jgi:hypothetical protein